jgi:hypothetical protein
MTTPSEYRHDSSGFSRTERFLKESGTLLSGEKMMFIIVWNPGAFCLINVLLKGFKLNAGEDRTQNLGPLSDWHRSQVARANQN